MINFFHRGVLCSAGLMLCVAASPGIAPAFGAENLLANGSLRTAHAAGQAPAGFHVSGDVLYGRLGNATTDPAIVGFRLLSADDINNDGQIAGEVTAKVERITADDGRWFRLRVAGLAQDGFAVGQERLYLRVEFFRDSGTTPLDQIRQQVYALVEQQRRDLADAGTNKKLGRATWRSYDLEFRTPFAEIDTLRIAVGFERGQGKPEQSEFWINEIQLTHIAAPSDYQPPAGGHVRLPRSALPTLTPLGGRWYYLPSKTELASEGEKVPHARFDYTNADRLFYLADDFEAPFADNTSAWLKAGFKDLEGRTVVEDRLIQDNVVVSFTGEHLVLRTRGLPNHPTAKFPDRTRSLDGNPNYIQEQDSTWFIPLQPKPAAERIAMRNENNNDHALPMGPIGVAVNGVVFFNPFDHLLDEDAVWRLDRCCGHPAPNSLYHYHKYPVCLKTPWCDDGTQHSPLIGFAMDGFPVYGPYEAQSMLAHSSADNPLNEYNVHHDEQRGWHYHVTPGRFPHIIGGYWGEVDVRNRRGPGRRPPGPNRARPPR